MFPEGAVQAVVEAEVFERDRRRIMRDGLERDGRRGLGARHLLRLAGT